MRDPVAVATARRAVRADVKSVLLRNPAASDTYTGFAPPKGRKLKLLLTPDGTHQALRGPR